MITRIRNSILVKSREVLVLRSNLTLDIVKILKEEGFVDSFEECGEVFMSKNGLIHKYISITLKYKGVKQKSYITNLKRISRPGFRVYVGYKNAPRVLGGVGVAVSALRGSNSYNKVSSLFFFIFKFCKFKRKYSSRFLQQL